MGLFEGKKDIWNNLVTDCFDFTFYQSFEWGEIKRKEGWAVKRFFFKENEDFVLAQVLKKNIPFFKIKFFWIPGGPLLSNVNNIEILRKLILEIENYYLKKKFIIRFNQQVTSSAEMTTLWRQLGYRNSLSTISLNLNIVVDFDIIKSFENNSHSKFRYCIRRAKKEIGHTVEIGKGDLLEDAIEIYSQMIKEKNINQFRSRNLLINLIEELKNNIQIFLIKLNGIPVSAAIIIYFKNKAFYFMGATNETGRKALSSYYMFDQIQKWCLDNKIVFFDLCGIDPLTNYDTYRFKKRTEGSLVEYIGEKEKASSIFTKALFNLGIHFRNSF